jgi:hypothetical protein
MVVDTSQHSAGHVSAKPSRRPIKQSLRVAVPQVILVFALVFAAPTVAFCGGIVSTGSGNIGQECLAAHLIFAERNN